MLWCNERNTTAYPQLTSYWAERPPGRPSRKMLSAPVRIPQNREARKLHSVHAAQSNPQNDRKGAEAVRHSRAVLADCSSHVAQMRSGEKTARRRYAPIRARWTTPSGKIENGLQTHTQGEVGMKPPLKISI